jgi:hypothetical protein
MCPIQIYHDGSKPSPWICTSLHNSATSMANDLGRVTRLFPPPIGTKWTIAKGPIPCSCGLDIRWHYVLNAEPMPKPQLMIRTAHGTFPVEAR